MDDFATGPSDFYVWFVSSDSTCVTQQYGRGYIFDLKKPLDFPNEWEVGVKQIIMKIPFMHKNDIRYLSPDKPDEKKFSNFFSFLSNWFSDTLSPRDLIHHVNSAIPESIKKDFSLEIDDDKFAVLNIKNTRVMFSSDYLADVLGFQPNTVYPELFPTKTNRIKGARKIDIPNPIFCLETDLTVPVLYGSYNRQIICMDIFSSTSSGFVNYKYENVSYYRILRSYVSSIFISLTIDNNNIIKYLSDPLIIQFHFRRSSIL